MAEVASFAQFLQKLATINSPSEQAALVAESAFAQLAPQVALVARRCSILRWFDPIIVTALLPQASAPETLFAADEVTNQLAQLPFVERLPWGLTYHEPTRTGLLERYAKEQPHLLKESAIMAAPAYQQHANQALAGQESLFCWVVAGELDKAKQRLDDLLQEVGEREDWNELLALFVACDQAAFVPFVPPLPYTAFHHFVQGVALQQLGNREETIAAYQRAIDLDDKFAYPWNGLGNVYRDQKCYADAINAYQRAIALDDKFVPAWNGLGNVYRDQKRYADAINAYQRAIALDDKFVPAWNGLYNVYRDQKRYADAINAYQRATALGKKFFSQSYQQAMTTTQSDTSTILPNYQNETSINVDPNLSYDVFLSYSHHDAAWVRNVLLPRLTANRLRVCIDINDFSLGAPLITEIERAVLQSRKTILVLTPDYLTSEWSEFENILVSTFDPAARTRRLLPLLLKPAKLPLRIRALNCLDFSGSVDEHSLWNRLLATLHTDITTTSVAAVKPSTVPTNPLTISVDLDRLQRTLKMARRTLTILEEQAAAYTALSIPAHLRIELEEKRNEVAHLKAQLEALGANESNA